MAGSGVDIPQEGKAPAAVARLGRSRRPAGGRKEPEEQYATRGAKQCNAATPERQGGCAFARRAAGEGQHVPVSYTHLRAHETSAHL
eukprot:14735059-Alexandrium_andersonii.AAC.1